jgi:hypothetical protein
MRINKTSWMMVIKDLNRRLSFKNLKANYQRRSLAYGRSLTHRATQVRIEKIISIILLGEKLNMTIKYSFLMFDMVCT